jgi:hypothetical protein
MALNFKRFIGGIQLVGVSSSAVTLGGEVEFLTSTNKLNMHNGTTASPLVSEAHTATLTNKTLSGNTATNLISGSGTITFNTTGTITVPNATDTLVGKATSDVLTNKTLTGNTAVNLISGSGTLIFNTTGTITVPNGTDTLVGKATSDVLTSKSIDSDNNTLTNIVNANIKAAAGIVYSKLTLTNSIVNADVATAAAIVRTKLANTSVSHVLINDGSGVMSSEATLAKSRGGSGQDNSSLTFPSTGTLATLAGTESLSNKTFSDAVQIAELATPSTPSSGFMKVYPKSDGKLYTLNDDGTETAVGSGAGGINYISANPDAESGTTGWATYADAAGTTPVDGTGGSPTTTWTRTTSTPLRGTASFLMTKDAANRQGEGASYAFTIASADKAKVLTISFEYEVSANFVSASDSTNGDLVVYIYDVTNAVVIQPAGYKLVGGTTGGPWKFAGSFQAASNSTSYRLILHIAGTTATAWTVKVDTVSVGPTVEIMGAPVTDWLAFTPTGSWSSNTTYTGFWRRVGDMMNIQVKVATSGAPTSANLTVNLPTGYTIDTAKLTDTAAGISDVYGTCAIRDGGTDNYKGLVRYNSTSSVAIYKDDGDDSCSPVTQATPFTWGNTDYLTFFCQVPIAGWASTTVLSQDTDTRVCAALYTGNGGTALTIDVTNITFTNSNHDTHGAWSGTVFTAPIPGIYQIAGAWISTTNITADTDLYVNGSKVLGSIGRDTSTDDHHPFRAQWKLNAGDTMSIRSHNTATLSNQTYHVISINRLSGPATVAASEYVGASYKTNSGTAIVDSVTDIPFITKIYDTHSAWSGSAFTAPSPGYYLITGFFRTTTSVSENTYAYINGAKDLRLASDQSGTSIHPLQTGVFKLNAGDTLSIRGDTNATLAADTNVHWITISKQNR